MPKLRLKPLDDYKFRYKTTIKVRDINYGGHLSNDAVVGIMHEARIDMMNKLDNTELDLGDGKTGTIMADLSVMFKSQGYMGDNIAVFTSIEDISPSSYRVYYKIMRDETLLVLAESGIVAFNYDKNSIGEIPEDFINRLDNFNEKM